MKSRPTGRIEVPSLQGRVVTQSVAEPPLRTPKLPDLRVWGQSPLNVVPGRGWDNLSSNRVARRPIVDDGCLYFERSGAG